MIKGRLTSLYGEYHSSGWAPGPPAPLGSAWRPQSVIWNIILLSHLSFLFVAIFKSEIWYMKYDAMWNPLVCHEKREMNYVPREIFWWPSLIFFISLCIPYMRSSIPFYITSMLFHFSNLSLSPLWYWPAMFLHIWNIKSSCNTILFTNIKHHQVDGLSYKLPYMRHQSYCL